MKIVAIIQARMGSTRLPGKVLKDIMGRPTLDWVLQAALKAPGIDEVVVATSTLAQDDPIEKWQSGLSDYAWARLVRGSETDVLSRFMMAAEASKADVIVRLTADCPFLDPNVIGEVIKLREIRGAEYATNTDPPTFPDGLDVEVFTMSALEIAHREATRGTDRDTVTRFLVRNRHLFPSANLVCSLPNLVRERWVLDSPEDYEFIVEVAKRLGDNRCPPSYLQILSILDKEPSLRAINAKFSRNERFYEALIVEKDVKRSYSASKAMLAKAEKLIPLGTQTFSKSKLMFPEGTAPLFVTHGDGAYVFDMDGNDYVDCIGALLPNILGYRDPDVDSAIRDQLSNGISFSLSNPSEERLAALLNKHIPSAEMVKFGKNGSDVTTAAVRLARHITARDKVWVAGYHGWHDWSMAVTDRDNGIPGPVGALSYKMPWNKDDGTGHDEFAAVIIEPEFFTAAELKNLQDHCHHYGSILIFDEIITGFRCGLGGLQKVHGVTPDLSCFGKSMANGMPISALVGLRKYMERMPEISYSGTFFGETLSIAAAIATIEKLERNDVHAHLKELGGNIRSAAQATIDGWNIGDCIAFHGPIELNRLKFKNNDIHKMFIQEMANAGVLIIGSNNTSYAHKDNELDRIIQAYHTTCKVIFDAIESGTIRPVHEEYMKGVR